VFEHTLQQFLHVWLKRMSLVLLNEYICKTSPNSEMRDIGFPLEPGFVRSHAFERGHRVASASPQSDGGSCASYSIAEISSPMVRFARSATPFCCGVLRVVWRLGIPQESENLMNSSDMYVFPPFVVLQFLDFRIELVFSSGLEQLEGLKRMAAW